MKKAKNRRRLLPVLVLLGLLAAFVIPGVITARNMANEGTGPEAKVERLVLDQLEPKAKRTSSSG